MDGPDGDDPAGGDDPGDDTGDAAAPAGGPPFAGRGTADALRDHWTDLVGEMEDVAGAYRDDGWSVLELHPGDVTVVTERRRGLDVLVPDDEFERLADWVADGTFDDHEVYRAEAGIVFLLVVLRDAAAERAICCPVYYADADAGRLRDVAEAEGCLSTHVRNLANDYVTFTHAEVEPFLPPDAA